MDLGFASGDPCLIPVVGDHSLRVGETDLLVTNPPVQLVLEPVFDAGAAGAGVGFGPEVGDVV